MSFGIDVSSKQKIKVSLETVKIQFRNNTFNSYENEVYEQKIKNLNNLYTC